MSTGESSPEDPQIRNPFSGGMEGMTMGVILTTVISTVIGILGCLSKSLWKKCQRRCSGFFNWEEPSTHSVPNRHDSHFNIRTCSICLENITLPVMSACNHPFCGKCIVLLWNSKNKQKLNCPYCRRSMNLLYKDFEEAIVVTQEEKKVLKQLKDYNHRFSSHHRTLSETIRDAPFLLRVLLDNMTFQNLLFVLTAMISSGKLIAAVIYILSPFDLLPEAILGPIGFIDDAVVIGFVLLTIANISYQLLRRLN